MAQRYPLVIDEWYHCYNRGVDKRRVFQGKSDYERFLLLMYTANGSKPIHISNLKEKRLHSILAEDSFDRGNNLVEIGAYSLMPNHFHFVLKEIREGGVATFMQKMFTGYTMYFNKKNERTGALFGGPFKSKHIADDRYLKKVVSYVHLNPVELYEPKWKEGRGAVETIEQQLRKYPYSSLLDFTYEHERREKKLLGDSIFDLFDALPSTREMLEDAQEYYAANFIKARP